MPCKYCKVGNSKTFNSEVAFHFPGLDGLDKMIVWAFPKLQVCLQCGVTEFSVPQRELAVLREGRAVNGSVALIHQIDPVQEQHHSDSDEEN
jgi:hypothetical protein